MNNKEGFSYEGIAGASYNSQLDVRLWETASTGANYIRFATDAGAVAMNFSWGGDYDQNLNDAVNYALSRDVIIVAAGPEDGTRVTKDYPTDYNRVEIIT